MTGATTIPKLAKWGRAAMEMAPPGAAATDPKTLYNMTWVFQKTTDGPVIVPLIPPQGLIIPGKDEVDLDLYIVWSPIGAGGLPTQKAGWIAGMVEVIEGGSIMDMAGLFISPSNLSRDDNGEVDWGGAGPPVSYLNYPYLQYGLAYDVAGDLYTLHKTKVASFKYVDGNLAIDSSRRSMGNLSGTVNGKQVFSGLYIWRAQAGTPSITLPAAFGPGVFDADGDGALDTDDYDDDVALWGIIGEFR